MKKEIEKLIDLAEDYNGATEINGCSEWSIPYSLAAIAASLQAIAKMLASDREKESHTCYNNQKEEDANEK